MFSLLVLNLNLHFFSMMTILFNKYVHQCEKKMKYDLFHNNKIQKEWMIEEREKERERKCAVEIECDNCIKIFAVRPLTRRSHYTKIWLDGWIFFYLRLFQFTYTTSISAIFIDYRYNSCINIVILTQDYFIYLINSLSNFYNSPS